MQIEPDVVAIIAVAAAATSVVLLVVVVALARRLRSLRRSHQVAVGDSPPDDLVGALATQADGLAQMAGDLRSVHADTSRLRELQRSAVTRLGLVRYDAFPDMGGMASFSAALLDESGDGIVLSAINGRQEARTYGKPIHGATSEHSLSDEERAAVRAAMDRNGTRTRSRPVAGRRPR